MNTCQQISAPAGDTFDADRLIAEMWRQSAVTQAKLDYKRNNGDATTNEVATRQFAVDVRAADVNYLRSCLASARRNGRQEASFLNSLKDIGAEA